MSTMPGPTSPMPMQQPSTPPRHPHQTPVALRRGTPWRTLPRAARFLLAVAVLDLLALIVVVAICWLGGWERPVDYGRGLVYAGLALLAVAGLRFAGTMSDAPQPSVFAGDDSGVLALDQRDYPDRMRRAMMHTTRAVPLPLLLFVAAAVVIAAGLLLQ